MIIIASCSEILKLQNFFFKKIILIYKSSKLHCKLSNHIEQPPSFYILNIPLHLIFNEPVQTDKWANQFCWQKVSINENNMHLSDTLLPQFLIKFIKHIHQYWSLKNCFAKKKRNYTLFNCCEIICTVLNLTLFRLVMWDT